MSTPEVMIDGVRYAPVSQAHIGVKVIIEMYTGASDEPVEVRELSVGDKFDDLSDQWSWFKVAGFSSPGNAEAAPPVKAGRLRATE